MLYNTPWSRFEFTISVVIATDYTGGCKSNYHTSTTTMAPCASEAKCHWLMILTSSLIFDIKSVPVGMLFCKILFLDFKHLDMLLNQYFCIFFFFFFFLSIPRILRVRLQKNTINDFDTKFNILSLVQWPCYIRYCFFSKPSCRKPKLWIFFFLQFPEYCVFAAKEHQDHMSISLF